MAVFFNGIGVNEVGQSDVVARRAHCPWCGTLADLQSYNTRLFVSVMFMPLIPIESQHITDACSSCKKRSTMGRHRWERERNEAISATTAAQRAAPNDMEAANAAINAACSFVDMTAFLNAAALIEEHQLRNAEAMYHLGAGYLHFGLLEDAADAFAASRRAMDTPQIRGAEAHCRARLGQPDAALSLAEDAFRNPHEETVTLATAIAISFQAAGRHEEALASLDRLEAVLPDAAKHKIIKSLRKVSENHRTSGKAVKHPLMKNAPDAVKPSSRWKSRVVVSIAPILILAMLGAYLAAAVSRGNAQTLYIVNGTGQSYTVAIAGRNVELHGWATKQIQIAEGRHVVAVSDTKLPMPDQEVVIESPLWLRPLRNHTFILNPDRAALVIWEQAKYLPNQPMARWRLARELPSPKLLHVFTGVDYHFTAFPAQIRLGRRGSSLRQRVDTEIPDSAFDGAMMIEDSHGEGPATEYLQQRAIFEPETGEALEALSNFLQPAELLAFIEQGINQRPLLAEWHRARQIALLAAEPDRNLLAEYEAIRDASPNDPAGQYLVARLIADDDERERMFSEALGRGLRSATALRWLANRCMSSGRFEDAARHLAELTAYPSMASHARDMQIDALIALGRLDEARQVAEARSVMRPHYPSTVVQLMMIHQLQGNTDAMGKAQGQFLRSVSDQHAPQELDEYRRWLDAVRAYLQGDAQSFGEQMIAHPWTMLQFQGLISLGRITEARVLLETSEEGFLLEYLSLVVAARAGGDEATASWAIETLFAEEEEERISEAAANPISRMLAGPNPPAIADVQNMPLQSSMKALLLTAVGQRHASIREPCFASARRLNFDRQYPYLLIRQVIDGAADSVQSTP